MKRILTALVSGLLLLSSALPVAVQAQTSADDTFDVTAALESTARINKDDFVKLRHVFTMLVDVDEENDLVSGLIANKVQRFDASEAVVVNIGNNGATTISLGELDMGKRTHMWVKRYRRPGTPTKAMLIVQASFAKSGTDGNPLVKFSTSSSNGSENQSSVDIPVKLSHPSSRPVTLYYSIAGTASGDGVDFSTGNRSFIIPAFHNGGSIHVDVVDDTLDEVNETIVFTLTDAVGGAIGSAERHVYTIRDNDQPVAQFSAATWSVFESETIVNVPVTLSKSSSHEVTLKYIVTGGTATGGSLSGGADYTLSTNEVRIAPGATSANIQVTVHNDSIDEPDETFTLMLTESQDATLGGQNVHVHTILDND